MADIILLNGPNLNRLGQYQVAIYGRKTLAEITQAVEEIVSVAGHKLIAFQSNHEGQLIDFISEHKAQFLLLNAAAYTHTSIALRDAVSGMPLVEIHLSNIYQREEFRKKSLFSDIAQGLICGFGELSYTLAAQFAVHFLAKNHSKKS